MYRNCRKTQKQELTYLWILSVLTAILYLSPGTITQYEAIYRLLEDSEIIWDRYAIKNVFLFKKRRYCFAYINGKYHIFRTRTTHITRSRATAYIHLYPKRNLNFPYFNFLFHLPLLTSLLFLFHRVFGASYQMLWFSYPTTHKIKL